MTEAATKAPNYTEDMVERMLEMYERLGNDGLDEIAEALDRPVRSVRSKLVREGVYVAPDKPKGSGFKREGPTKKELLRQLEDVAPFPVEGFMGATKAAINDLIVYLTPKPE